MQRSRTALCQLQAAVCGRPNLQQAQSRLSENVTLVYRAKQACGKQAEGPKLGLRQARLSPAVNPISRGLLDELVLLKLEPNLRPTSIEQQAVAGRLLAGSIHCSTDPELRGPSLGKKAPQPGATPVEANKRASGHALATRSGTQALGAPAATGHRISQVLGSWQQLVCNKDGNRLGNQAGVRVQARRSMANFHGECSRLGFTAAAAAVAAAAGQSTAPAAAAPERHSLVIPRYRVLFKCLCSSSTALQ